MKVKGARKALTVTAGAVLAAPRPATAKQGAATLARLGCVACPLNTADVNTPKMQPTLALGSGVYVLAEAPGAHEDESSGKPLTGPSGRLLRECIPDGCDCSFDNVVNCRPEGNRTPTWQEAECCRPRRVKWIEQAKPKLILGLGAVPLKFMLGSTDLQGMRGRLFAVKVGNHSCWFLPTYHPSFILRTAYDKKKPLNGKLGHCFRLDIGRAFALCPALIPPNISSNADIRSGIIGFPGGDLHELTALLALALKAPIKAIDIETKGLRPYAADAAIMSVAISFDDTHFSFALDHPKSQWSPHQRLTILNALEAILKDDTIKVAHNVPFELEWFIWLFGREVVNHAAWECTQMQAQFLDERRGKAHGSDDHHRAAYQSLDFLCKQHFGTAYKSMFKLDKKDMSKSDLGETLLYNGVDTRHTLRLYHRQTELLRQLGLHDAYLEALPRQASVALMQTLGVMVDQAEVKRIQGALGAEIKVILDQISDLKVVKTYAQDKGVFNPASGPDTLAIFKDYLKCPEVHVEGRLSVDKSVLDQIEHPLANLIVQLRNKSKLKSTYVDGLELGKGSLVHPDGKIHCNFNTTFAETGRTSSDDPNMQNFPQRKDSWVRKQVVPEAGHVLVAFDYGQLEACTAAMCSQDAVLVKALWEDYDIHMEWAQKLAAAYPQVVTGDMKKFRSLVKNKLVFPAIFGAQDKSIAGYLGIPEDIVATLMDEFWATFHGLKAWQDKVMRGYYDTGWVASPTGRRHRYPLTRNQAINHPVQSLACEIVCDAMCRLSAQAVATRNWNLHPRLNIHDDLTFSVVDTDACLEHSVETIYRTMLTPPYPCVNVPLSVKASVGRNWYEMTEIGQFWSHKDL